MQRLAPGRPGWRWRQPAADCNAFATVLCARRWECIAAAFELGHGFGDAFGTEEVCVERLVLACQGWQRLPGTRATAEALASCTEAIAELDCRTSTHTLTYTAARCDLERGTLPVGAACEVNLQCESESCERRPEGYRCGERVDPPPEPELGAECAAAGCGRNLVCLGGVCSAPALAGEPCGPDRPSCAPYAELRCDETGICVPLRTGGGCGRESPGGERLACAEGECVARNDFGRGVCRPYSDDGAACDPYAGPSCLYPAKCREDLCRLPGL